MSRPNREFKLADDDTSTNDFINNVAKSAPKKKVSQIDDAPMNIDRGGNNEPWTSDIYTRLNGDGTNRRRGEGFTVLSVLVMLFNAILLAAGLALIIIAAVQKSQKLLPICPACDKTMIVMYVVGAFVIFVGALGIVAAKTRSKCAAIPYCGLLAIVGLVFLGMTIGVVVIVTNTNGLHLDEAWASEVKDDPESICELQNQWQCSGYSVCCNGVVDNVTTIPTTTELTTTPADTTTAIEPTTEVPPATTEVPPATTTEVPPATTEVPPPETTSEAPEDVTTTEEPLLSSSADENVTTSAPAEVQGRMFRGFDITTGMPEPTTPGTCFASHDGMLPQNVVEQCVPGCASNTYERRCEESLKDKLKDNLGIILAALIPATLLSALMCFLSIRMTRNTGVE